MKLKSNLKKRVYATILDYGLTFLVSFAYILFFGMSVGNGTISVYGLEAFFIAIVWFLYFVVIEAEYGATLGHQSFNLKVMTIDRKDVEFNHSLERHLLDPIDIYVMESCNYSR